MAFEFFEDMDTKQGPENLKLRTLGEFVGLDMSESHDAIVDVQNTAELMIRFMKRLRIAARKTRYKE
jgi:DNA polymerase III epsilon subunit-like protein